MVCLNVLTRHLQPQAIQARERAQIRAIKDSIGHVEVFQMDGVGTPIIGRPRPIPGHDTPNPANNTYTLNYEEPLISTRVPRGLTELITLGRTLKRRAGDILAYFDHPHTSNGPTEAINGRLEHLRGSALGFRNLTHYITRALLETGGFRPQLHPQL